MRFIKRDNEKRFSKKRSKLKDREKKTFEALKKYSTLKPKRWYHFFIKLFTLIMKNYKLMIRSKASSLIFFFGPLLIIFLVSIGFNTSTLYDINIASYSDSYSPLANSLLSNLSDNQYRVVKLDAELECINAVKFGSSHVCLIFPKDMVLDNSGNNNLILYVDNSRINVANLITEKLASKVAIRSTELSSGIVSQILGSLDTINQEAVKGPNYIAALAENNKKSKGRVVAALSDFSMYDFEYGVLDIQPAFNEIEDIRDRYNLSSTAFIDLKDKITSSKTQYNQLAAKLDEARSQSDGLESSVSAIATTVDENKPNIVALKDMNENILEQINIIKITNVESIVSPLRTVVKPLSLKKSYLVYTFPTLLVLLVMFVSLLMSATSIMREKKSMAYFRNFITPTFDGMFLAGQFLSDISIIFFQLIIILGVASIFIKGLSWQVYFVACGILLLLASIFIFMGLFLGYLFKSEESVTTGAVSIGLVFLLFSNAIMPLESLSGFLRQIVLYNPFVVGESILKRLVLFDSFASIHGPIYILLVWIGVTAVLAIMTKIITRRVGR